MKLLILVIVINVTLYAVNASVLRLPTPNWIQQNYAKLLEAKGNHTAEYQHIIMIAFLKVALFRKRRQIPATPATPAADKRSAAVGGPYQTDAHNLAIKAFWPHVVDE